MKRLLGSLVGVGALLAVPTWAGIADSPLPVLQAGAPTLHLYSVPGVMNDAGTNLATFFSCTSTSTAPQTVGIELFAAAGGAPINNAATTALVVPPGATVVCGSSGSVFADRNLSAGVLSKGSARVLSTSKFLICTVFVAESFNATPQSGWQLTIIAKTKQKAHN